MTAVASHRRFPCPCCRRGKVRDVYDVDAERLLLVATDRVSAFDVVMHEPVPHKGAVLTQLTAWWLRQLGAIVPHHMLERRRRRDRRRRCRRSRAHRDDARGPRDALPPHGGLSRRVRGARLHLRVGVEGVPRASERWPASRSPPGLRESEPVRPADLQPGDQGGDRARREHHASPRWRGIVGDETARELEAADACACTSAGAIVAGAARNHHRRHQVRVRPRRHGARSCSSTKC